VMTDKCQKILRKKNVDQRRVVSYFIEQYLVPFTQRTWRPQVSYKSLHHITTNKNTGLLEMQDVGTHKMSPPGILLTSAAPPQDALAVFRTHL
jgi:hypothetical protein